MVEGRGISSQRRATVALTMAIQVPPNQFPTYRAKTRKAKRQCSRHLAGGADFSEKFSYQCKECSVQDK